MGSPMTPSSISSIYPLKIVSPNGLIIGQDFYQLCLTKWQKIFLGIILPTLYVTNEEDYERVEETFTDPEHGEFTIKERTRVPLILGRPFLRTARALIDVYGEEMILRDGNERLILNMRNDTSSYLNEPHQESINMIDINEEYLENLFSTSHPREMMISDYSLEEFADELALIDSFPPGNDDMTPEDVINLLNLDKTKDLPPYHDNQSNSVHENSFDDNLDDTISEMFTDEHALDYSSPPLWDDYDDDLFDHESSDFLLFPKCDSVFYEDFSEVDVLPSTNNEDKVFNPGILIHENLFEVTNFATPDKNVKKATNASLILEDFNPPLYELPFHKEVPRLGAVLSFSSENEEKVFNPEILTSKRVHTSLLPELSHRGTKAFKVTKILESPLEIFPCSYQEDIRILDVSCLYFYPPWTRSSMGGLVKLSD
ncbi:hypothetical protein Tco_0660193 [Tanacetum coccineum]